MEYLTNLWQWVKDRAGERTSWDGIVLIVLGLLVLFGGVFVKVIAAGAIVWGVYTLVKSQAE